MSHPIATPDRSLPPLHSGAPSTQPAASYSPYRHYQSPRTIAEPPFQLTRVGSFSARQMSPLAPYSDITQPFPAMPTDVNPHDEGAKAATMAIMAIDALFHENFYSPFGSVEEALANDTDFMNLANPDSSERRIFNLSLSGSHAELATRKLTKWKNRSGFHRENITNFLRESEKLIEERRKLRQELIRKIKAGGDLEEAQHRLNMQRGGGALNIAQQVDHAVDEGFVIVHASATERPKSGLTLPFVRSVFNRYKDRLREVKPEIIYKQLFLHQHTPSEKKQWHNILLAMSDNDWHRNQHVQKHIHQLKDIGYLSQGFAPRGVQTDQTMSVACMKDLVCEVYLCLPTEKPGGYQGLRLVPSTSGGTHLIQNPDTQATEAEMAPATAASPAENAAFSNTESQVAVRFNQGTQPAPSPTQADVGQKPSAVAYKQGEAQPMPSEGAFNTKPQAAVQFNQGIQKAPPPTQFDTAVYKQGEVQPAPVQFAANTADTTGSLFGGTAASGNTNMVLFGGASSTTHHPTIRFGSSSKAATNSNSNNLFGSGLTNFSTKSTTQAATQVGVARSSISGKENQSARQQPLFGSGTTLTADSRANPAGRTSGKKKRSRHHGNDSDEEMEEEVNPRKKSRAQSNF